MKVKIGGYYIGTVDNNVYYQKIETQDEEGNYIGQTITFNFHEDRYIIEPTFSIIEEDFCKEEITKDKWVDAAFKAIKLLLI